VVDILLGAVALVAWSKSTACSLWEQAGLKAGSLGVVVDIIDNDAPFTFNILGTFGGGIGNIRGADVTFWSSPVGDIIGRVTSGCTSVVGVVKSFLLVLGDHVNEIISRLISNISILLSEEVVSADGSLDFIGWVFIIFKAVCEGGVGITGRGSGGITVGVFVGGGLVAIGRTGLVAIGWGMGG